ncbi:Isopentenyl phosphate kinase [Candidatus Anstonella stagnisolia]|nr:Isopentenyl phosphate kinase [Candidatus Anstonella stagnisolia]
MQIVKLGGSVITRKSGFEKANLPALRSLCKQIAHAHKKGAKFIIVHGAGSFGHPHVLKYKIQNGVRTHSQALGFAKTHESVAKLSELVVAELTKAGVPCASVPPLAIVRTRNNKIIEFCTDAIDSLLKLGITPVLYGDVVIDEKIGGCVVSGDTILSALAKRAQRLILFTNVDGIYAGKVLVREINKRNSSSILKHVGNSKHKDVTGGMRGKLLELLKTNKPAFIANGNKPSRVRNILLGKKDVCTRIN